MPEDSAQSFHVGRLVQLYLSGFGADQVTCAFRAPPAEEAEFAGQRAVLAKENLWLTSRLLTRCEGPLDSVVGEALASAAHALAHLRFSAPNQPIMGRKPLHLAMLSVVEDARVERMLLRELPGVATVFQRFHEEDGNRGKLDVVSLTARLARALRDADYEDPNAWVNKGRRLFEAGAERLEDRGFFEEIASILANDLGQMRVPFDPLTQVIAPIYGDDHSFLWAAEDVPPETPPEEALARKGVLWEATETDSDRPLEVSAAESTERERFSYPEWDTWAGMLREDWVQVFEYAPLVAEGGGEKQKPASAQARCPSMLDSRALKLDRRICLRRQKEGDALDLNGAIEARIHLRAGVTPDPRVFERPGRRPRRVAIALLVDLSESANDRVGGSFTTVLDLEKRAVAMVAKAVERGPDLLAVHGFQSNGRHEVQYRILKSFGQPFELVEAQPAWRQLQAGLSTRLGAALRHGGRLLGEQPAEKRILFVLTDGLPSDVDVPGPIRGTPEAGTRRGEGQSDYLVEDARQAGFELGRGGVSDFCLTLDQGMDPAVRRIFGARRVQVVDDARHLSRHLLRALDRVAAS